MRKARNIPRSAHRSPACRTSEHRYQRNSRLTSWSVAQLGATSYSSPATPDQGTSRRHTLGLLGPENNNVPVTAATGVGNRGKTSGGSYSYLVLAGQQPVEDGRERPYVPAISIVGALCPPDRDRRDKPGDDEPAPPRVLPLLHNRIVLLVLSTFFVCVVAELDQILFLLLVARLQLEQARRGAAEDVVLALLGEERQVVDGRRQIEVPMRIVGRVEEMVFRIHHAERLLQRFEVLDLHGLRGVIHIAHVFARLFPEQRTFGRSHHVFMVEPLHQERYPGNSGLDPDHRQLGEALAHAVYHPVGAVKDVVKREAERMHRNETVAAAEHVFG